MLKLSSLFIAFLIVIQVSGRAQSAKEVVLPMPNRVKMSEGTLTLKKSVSIHEIGAEKVLNYLTPELKERFELQTKKKKSGAQLNLIVQQDADMDKEEYLLDITKKGITITGSDATGIFYGVQSLLQLMDAGEQEGEIVLSWQEIKDKPCFSWRFYTLDECRYFFGEQNVYALLDAMAEFKMNVLHWYLTDDVGQREEIKQYLKLTEIGSKCTDTEIDTLGHSKTSGKVHQRFYTQKQIKKILKYAKERYIKVVSIDSCVYTKAYKAGYRYTAPLAYAAFQRRLDHMKYAKVDVISSDSYSIYVSDRNAGKDVPDQEVTALNWINNTHSESEENFKFKGDYYTWSEALLGKNSNGTLMCPSTWRLPTAFELLLIQGKLNVSGNEAILTGTNGASCFFPFSGYQSNTDSICSDYWSSTTIARSNIHAYSLNVSSGQHSVLSIGKGYGLSVRCVKTVPSDHSEITLDNPANATVSMLSIGDSKVINFNSTKVWSLSITGDNTDWCIITNKIGETSGASQFTINATINTTPTPRTATVTITTEGSTETITLTQIALSSWGLTSPIGDRKSHNRSYEWYIDQLGTGAYESNNCGPTVSIMVLKWYNESLNRTVQGARSEIKPEGECWRTQDIKAYLEKYGTTPKYYKFNTLVNLKTVIDSGCIAILCLDMYDGYFTKSAGNPAAFRMHKYLSHKINSGHFIIVKGYIYSNNKLYFEVYDPDSKRMKYPDGQLKGKDRYYLGTDILTAATKRWDWIIAVPPAIVPSSSKALLPSLKESKEPSSQRGK